MNPAGLYKTWLGVEFQGERPNHYELFGLSEGEQDREKIDAAAESAIGRLRSVQPRPGQTDLWAQLLDELYQAKACLTDSQAKKHYDAGLQAAARQPTTPSPMTPAAPMAADPMAAVAPVNPTMQPLAAQPLAAQPLAAQPVVAQPIAAQPIAAQPIAAQPVVAQPVVARPVAVAQATPVAAQPKPAGPQVRTSRSASKIARQRARKKSPVLPIVVITLLFVGGGVAAVQHFVGSDDQQDLAVQNLPPSAPTSGPRTTVVRRPRKPATRPPRNRETVGEALSGGFDESAANSFSNGGNPGGPASDPAMSNPAMPDKGAASVPNEPSSSSPSNPPSSTPSAPAPTDADRKQLAEAIAEARTAVEASKWNDAQRFLAAVKKTPKTSDDDAQYRRLATFVRYRVALGAAVLSGYANLKAGERLPLRNTTIEILEVRPKYLKVKIGDVVKRYPADELRPGLQLAVALTTTKENAERASLLKSVFYATHVDPNYVQARAELAAISGSNGDARNVLDYLNTEHSGSEGAGAAPAMAATPAAKKPSKPAPEPEASSLGATFQAARDALAVRDIALANELLEKAEKMDQTDDQKAMHKRLKQLTHFAGEYWNAVAKGRDGLKANDEISIRGELVLVVSSTEDELIIRARGRNIPVNLAEPLPENLAYALATRWLKQDDPVSAVTLGAYFATLKKPDFGEARRLWGLATKSGADIGDLALVLRDRYKF